MPFRVMAFEFGAGLATTELISAKGLFHRNKRTEQYLAFNSEVERPYSLQLFGGDEAAMAQAAVLAVEAGAQIIDINMGCPVKKVTQTGAGSALLCDPKRAAALIVAMRKSVQDSVPITAKIRTGWDEHHINCVEMGKALQDAGCAALAMHARSRAQGYSGKANWDLIGELKSALQIPVIGNGDVVSAEDAYLMQQQTGCDGVMIGRGALGNPWIFRELKTGKKYTPSLTERKDLVLRHLREHIRFHTNLDEARSDVQQRAVRSFRTHLVWYSRGLKDASFFRERVMHLDTLASVEQALHDFFETTHVDIRKSLPETESDEIDYRQAFG